MGSSTSPSWYLSAQKPKEYMNISGILAVYEYWMHNVKKARSIQYEQRTYGHDALECTVLPSRPAEAFEAIVAPEMMHKKHKKLRSTS